jgi:hypothetical protein
MSATGSASNERVWSRTTWRYVLLVHRYLGIGAGLIVLLWCTSGAIMMYVQYPELTDAEQIRGLSPLEVGPAGQDIPPPANPYLAINAFRVEAGPHGPLLRFTLTNGAPMALDLDTGEVVDRWSAAALDEAGAWFGGNSGLGTPTASIWVERDQWTVHGRFNPHRPLRKLTNQDGDTWYLSSATGAPLQATTGGERFWNIPGAVVHWIYPTELRQHTAVWAQVVIWLTIVGLFLTITGIAIGIRHFRWREGRRRSPYRGWSLWHHYTGLAFGLMTLVWLGSGLVSMNPWGALEGRSIETERRVLNGMEMTLGEAVSAWKAVRPHMTADTVRLQMAPWLGERFYVGFDQQGKARRYSKTGPLGPLTEQDVGRAIAALELAEARITRLEAGDNYYFAHHAGVELPVYRIETGESERFYLSEASGRLVSHYDRDRRWYRWLFEGLHRGDFAAVIRQRPLWDLLMLMLLGGTTAGALTGVYLAWRRVRPGRLPG